MTLHEFILSRKVDLLEFANYWLEGLLLDDKLYAKELSRDKWEAEFEEWLGTKELEEEIHNKFDRIIKK